MDYETVSPEEFGSGLRGFGFNLLVTDVKRTAAFLETVFGMKAHRLSSDFAIITQGSNVMQLHADSTYASNPLLGLLPENPPRGAGIEIRLYDCDPDKAAQIAEAAGGTILQAPTDKPHGLREAFILCADGYAWVPSRPKT
ncbi:VOC family protein [Lentibacter algarum]|uniref:VOC family protein n=1 Tax=Lentibacter algarum TaxID=576131 RepID=UPI001C07898C|nr:VOC family protein [Lentibacter algarum]MBU2980542.1 VOC family protein [Lentibacter algarum]